MKITTTIKITLDDSDYEVIYNQREAKVTITDDAQFDASSITLEGLGAIAELRDALTAVIEGVTQ